MYKKNIFFRRFVNLYESRLLLHWQGRLNEKSGISLSHFKIFL